MKHILTIIILSTFILPIFSSDLKFFEGIGGEFGDQEEDSITIDMDDQVKYVYNSPNMKTKNGVIIGHSQGGLRAVALSGYLNKHPKEDLKLNSVITIGSPVRGFSPITNGVAPLRTELNKAIKIITDALELTADKVNIDVPLEDDVLQSTGLEGALFDLITGHGDGTGTSIPDMKPNSQFIRDNIMKTSMKFKAVRLKIFGKTMILQQPYINIDYKLSKKTKYGFIIGKQSDIRKLMASTDQYKDVFTYPVGEIGSYKFNYTLDPKYITSAFNLAAYTAMNMYGSEAATNETLARISIFDPYGRRIHKKKAKKCRDKQDTIRKGKSWVYNLEENYSKLLGTEPGNNDCFIPSEDQYIDVTKFGGKTIDGLKGKYESKYLHHLNEMNSYEVWGKGGNLQDANVGKDGQLDTWLKKAKFSQRKGISIK